MRMSQMQRTGLLLLALTLITTGLTTTGLTTTAWAEPPPEAKNPIGVVGFEQLIPRGGIPAIVDPVFVDGAAAEIPDDAWVLGYAAAGEAYAYDLNLLNSHEVVNHKVGQNAIAAVW